MFSKRIISIFILYIIFCTIVQADNLNNKYQYVPKKGYVVDIENFNNKTIRGNILKELEEQKSQEENDNVHFKTFNMKIPYWKEQWEKNKDVKNKKYKNGMEVPDPKHNETVYQLMVMSRNAYVPPDSNDWVDLTDFGWKILLPFGWNDDPKERTANRVRGYIFVNPELSTLVVSIKGTSAGLFGIGGPTADYDKYNDNMMFSCCCAIVDISWKGICDCHSGIPNTCETKCLREKSLSYDNSYFNQLKSIFEHVEYYRIHENYEVYYTGHSLGGALASLSGLYNQSPVFTYEAPGEAQFADRIGIKPKENVYKDLPIYHFGNNGDPIYTGKCTGITSTCYYSGFAMETKCHVGKLYMFDLDKNRNNPDDDNNTPIGDNPDEQPVEDPKNIKNTKYTQTESVSKTKESPIFLLNKSSIDEHQFHMFMKRSEEEQIRKGEYDSSFKAPIRPPKSSKPSNPSKLNMLHHRIDYVISLLKKWEGPWPVEEIQESCIDCEDWTFVEGDGDEGRT